VQLELRQELRLLHRERLLLLQLLPCERLEPLPCRRQWLLLQLLRCKRCLQR
jgi:hypothetical protein